MRFSDFVHLHNHTEYSLLDGACAIVDDKGKPGQLLKRIANDHKMPALAITDHGNMYGAIEFYSSCLEVGIKPIIGCEVYVAPGSRFDKDSKRNQDFENYHHLTLIAKDTEGYQNLMKLVSLGFLEGFYYKPRIDKELLRKYSKGLVALSGCLAGEIPSFLMKQNYDKARTTAEEFKEMFDKGDFYIELMDNGLEDQKKIIPYLLQLSKELTLPLVATNDCHFLNREDAYDHDVLLCVGTGRTLDDPGRLKFASEEFYYKSPEEMKKLFSYIPEAISNTLQIAEKTNLQIDFNRFFLPKFQVPEGQTPETFLHSLCLEGLKKRYPVVTDIHKKRLEYELQVIKKAGFDSYFLIVWDFINYAKKQKITVGPGRGSGAGSIVAYTLGITDICPLKYGLLFERFLNPDRKSMPDLDIDFADKGRDRVIEYVINKYGNDNCAQIITFGSMQSRLVVRDVGRAMGFTPSETDRIAKMIPQGSKIYSALTTSPELKKLVKTDPRIEKLIATSQKLEGLKRHTGVHAAGMVIADDKITSFSPLAKGSKDIITTQYDGTILPKLGLLKVDFLGLRTLTVIDDAIELIKRTKDPLFDISQIPLDNEKTYKLLNEARTLGVFQLESRGMRDLMKKLQPSYIEDIIALIALYRPGPMGSGMLDDFVSRKHGKTKVKYDHPLLEPILKDTYGVILYQEQVMRISTDLAGFSAGQADSLRKAMGKKIPEEIEKQRESFLNGAKAKNIDKKLAEKIFEQIVHFGGYGFNKSHSAAYGIISYRTAYLKANFPIEFMTALLNSEIGHSAIKNDNEDNKLTTYVIDAEKAGIKILPPDIQNSFELFSIEGNSIRYGFTAIKNVGEKSVEEIVKERTERGPFISFDDFAKRAGPGSINKKCLESLIKAGVFDSLGENMLQTRASLMGEIDHALDIASEKKASAQSGQDLLFEMPANSPQKQKAATQPWTEHDALAFEKEVLGFYLSGHPLTKHQLDLALYSQCSLDKIPQTTAMIRIAGMTAGIKTLVSKSKKETYARFKLEDLYGQIDVVVFPKDYEKGLTNKIEPNKLIVVKGRLSERDNGDELIAQEIFTFEEAKKLLSPFSRTIRLKLTSSGLEPDTLEKIQDTIEKFSGNSPIVFDVKTPGNEEYSIETGLKVAPAEKFFSVIEDIIGPESWEMDA